jgi:hypothetical protein
MKPRAQRAFLHLVDDSLALIRDHLVLIDDEDTAAAFLDELSALEGGVAARAGVTVFITRLAALIRVIRHSAEAGGHPSAVRLRLREDRLTLLRDKVATRRAARR